MKCFLDYILEKHIEEEELIAKGEKIKFPLDIEIILHHFMGILGGGMVNL